MSRLIINELEKKAILKRYGVLTEQNVGQPIQTVSNEPPKKEELSIKKNVQFPAGYYNQSYLEKSELATEVQKVINFLTEAKNSKKATYVVNLSIRAGESQIPNTDNEDGGKKVPVGFLAQKRSETIVGYVNTLLNPYIGNVLPTGLKPIINVIPGETKWVNQVFCPANKLKADDKQGYECLQSNFKPAPNIQNWYYGKNKEYSELLEKYKTEQFVEVSISVTSEINKPAPTPSTTPVVKPCLQDMQIWINFEGSGHVCNSSVYEVYVTGNKGGRVLLTRYSNRKDGAKSGGDVQWASLNNKGFESKQLAKSGENTELVKHDSNPDKSGGERYNMFILPKDIEQLLNNPTELTIIAKCINPTKFKDRSGKNWGYNCHNDVGSVWVVPGGQISRLIKYSVTTPNELKSELPILKMDTCGKQIGDLAKLKRY